MLKVENQFTKEAQKEFYQFIRYRAYETYFSKKIPENVKDILYASFFKNVECYELMQEKIKEIDNLDIPEDNKKKLYLAVNETFKRHCEIIESGLRSQIACKKIGENFSRMGNELEKICVGLEGIVKCTGENFEKVNKIAEIESKRTQMIKEIGESIPKIVKNYQDIIKIYETREAIKEIKDKTIH